MLETAHYLSPFGCFCIQGSKLGIRKVKLVNTKPCPAGPIPPILKDCILQLDEYFKGQRQSFNLKLDWGEATDFHKAVWSTDGQAARKRPPEIRWFFVVSIYDPICF